MDIIQKIKIAELKSTIGLMKADLGKLESRLVSPGASDLAQDDFKALDYHNRSIRSLSVALGDMIYTLKTESK